MARKDGEFWINKKGERVHPDLIRADEQLKDEMVENLITKALEMSKNLKAFKEESFKDIEDYYDLLLQKYNMDAKKDSKKGNLTIENFSGDKKVTISIADRIEFDEKLNIAKAKIDEYLHEVTQNASSDIKTLITKAFEVDKKGDINAKKILALKGYEIKHPKWIEAMQIIDEAVQIVSSKSYIRFYVKEGDAYKQIPLDLAKV